VEAETGELGSRANTGNRRYKLVANYLDYRYKKTRVKSGTGPSMTALIDIRSVPNLQPEPRLYVQELIFWATPISDTACHSTSTTDDGRYLII
jgi:hypothetical protein